VSHVFVYVHHDDLAAGLVFGRVRWPGQSHRSGCCRTLEGSYDDRLQLDETSRAALCGGVKLKRSVAAAARWLCLPPSLVVAVAIGAVAVLRVLGAVEPPRDLMPALMSAEVCPGDGQHCWPPGMSDGLHHDVAGTGSAALPLNSSSNLYLRVPTKGILSLDFLSSGAVLGVRATGEDGTEVELYRGASPTGAGTWQTTDIPLATLTDQVIRLGLRAEARRQISGGQARLLVRHAWLAGSVAATGGDEDSRPLNSGRRPNVVLYLIDTLRADRLGCYGYPRPTSPRIDALTTSAVLFSHAVAQSSFTLPSTASILTGLNPKHHGAIEPEHGIRPEAVTVAETLQSHGYHTAGFVTNYLGSSVFGHNRGFDVFRFYAEEGARRPEVYLPSSALFRRVKRWLEHRAQTPFFLYIHATDPHFPYRPPRRAARPFLRPRTNYADALEIVHRSRHFFFGNESWGIRPAPLAPADVAVLSDLYDGDIRMADEGVGRLLDELAAHRLLDDTLLILTSDHGEEFLDHGGVAHSQTLYDEMLHVPLLIRLPGAKYGGTRVASTAQHVDIVPTILDLLGLAASAGLDGSPLFARRSADQGEAYSFLRLGGREIEGLTTTTWKVVHNISNPGQPPFEVYDLTRDPLERSSLATARDVRLNYSKVRFPDLGASLRPAGPSVDPVKLERLQALGYVSH